MAQVIEASNYVGVGAPAQNGTKLAEVLLQAMSPSSKGLVIDACECPPEYLVSSFFNAFWQRLYSEGETVLEQAKVIPWEFSAASYQKVHEYLRCHFKPREPVAR